MMHAIEIIYAALSSYAFGFQSNVVGLKRAPYHVHHCLAKEVLEQLPTFLIRSFYMGAALAGEPHLLGQKNKGFLPK